MGQNELAKEDQRSCQKKGGIGDDWVMVGGECSVL
jgi:hypothetical protein